MNAQPDMMDMLWAQYDCLSDADKCRFIDQAMHAMGPVCPVPGVLEVRDECDFFAKNAPQAVKVEMVLAIWASLTPAEKRAHAKWCAKQLEAGKAEPPAG